MKAVIIAIIVVFVAGMILAAVVAADADPQMIDVDPAGEAGG